MTKPSGPRDMSRALRLQRSGRTPMRAGLVMAAVLLLLARQAAAEDIFTVAPTTVADEKAVFATVESANVGCAM